MTGIDPAIKPKEKGTAISKLFDPNEGFGNFHALHLGSSKQEVENNLGEPKRRINKNEWKYDTTCACEIPEYFIVYFLNDRINKIVFSAPAG